jgi:chemotaxis protein methyltransferase CheR
MITITNKEFKQLADYIHANYGIHLKEEKRALVVGRLQNVLLSRQLDSFQAYYDYIAADRSGEAAAMLIDRMSTNHTFFMREAEHFRFLRNQVLPALASAVHDRDLRIWSAGCSSGEEPYTIAMLIDEVLGKDKPHWDAKVLATDISGQILEKAKKGVYRKEEIEELPPAWRMNYFNVMDREHAAVVEHLKQEVIFRKFNLMTHTFPFKRKFHVIFCRNVMIYFDNETKRALVDKFYQHLEPGGYLFIGHSESIHRDQSPFKPVMPAIYRKL